MIRLFTQALNLESHCDQNLSTADNNSAVGSMGKWRTPTIMHPGDVSFLSLQKNSTAI